MPYLEVNDLTNLKTLKSKLIDDNEWGEESKVSFYRNENSKPAPLTTKVASMQDGNSIENPLFVVGKSHCVDTTCFVCSPVTLTCLS